MSKQIIFFSMMAVAVAFSSVINAGSLPKTVYTPEDRQIFDRYIAYIGPWQSAHTDSLLEKTALFFLDTPYVPHTLEMPGEEKLVVNLREFDCTTFVESVIALVRTARSDNPDFDTFLNELQCIRYRGGNLQGYTSRLHYTSDWLYDNEKKGLLKNRSAGLGGIREEKTIDFMTTHRDAYRQLKDDDMLLRQMQVIENNINERNGFYYLSKRSIADKTSIIPHMSVVAFSTSIAGLDVTHMGFTFRKGGRLSFVHASSTRKKVVVDQKNLNDYCAGQSSCTGIIVAVVN
ncbi:N-acetylmuramoyl-L-alanine amidase-like domain-containing protein [Proteiniphilum sp.]|uniref:N-acetylmuramoyl-L-alanine amidase-like domain-containing protein n=1 Tax=Proteiniphilum sp. TaxID=1926877 RepID=UPI003316ED74